MKCLIVLWLACGVVLGGELPRSLPEAEGVSSTGLSRLVERLGRDGGGLHSLMVVRHGNVIAEGWWAPYSAERNHVLYSLSKSFASTAVGLAVAEGKVGIFDRVVDLFPDDLPDEVSGQLRAMRVRDLLTMATGHQTQPPTAPDEMSVRSFLAHPVEHKPGTHFMYNTAATFVQAAIVEKVTGERLVDYLRPRLFGPLGIEKPEWDTNHEGIALGGYGLRVKTEDIAKLGQLYLQEGMWGGKRLLAEDWVEMATSRMMSNGSDPESDWAQGYGFQFWRCRHGAYRGDGAFGQYCVVLPEQEMVVAITSGLKNMQGVLDILWEELLPAVKEGELAADADGVARLAERLGGLGMDPADGKREGGELGKVYALEGNDDGIESVALVEVEEGIELVVMSGGKESRIPCGFGQWLEGRAVLDAGRLASFGDEAVAGSYGWASADTCVVKVCAVETPFVVTWRMEFSGDRVKVVKETNVGFGGAGRVEMMGITASVPEPVERGIMARFIGADPGPPIGGASIDRSPIGAPYEVGERFYRQAIRVSLRGPGDVLEREGVALSYEGKAELIEEMSSGGSKPGAKWSGAKVLHQTEWVPMAVTILGRSGGSYSVTGDSDEETENPKPYGGKRLRISLDGVLNDEGSFEVEAVATWGEHSADASWEHRLETRGR